MNKTENSANRIIEGLKKGNSNYCEVYFSENKLISIDSEKNDIKVNVNTDCGFGCRAIRNGGVGFASISGNDITNNVSEIIENVCKSSECSESKTNVCLLSSSEKLNYQKEKEFDVNSIISEMLDKWEVSHFNIRVGKSDIMIKNSSGGCMKDNYSTLFMEGLASISGIENSFNGSFRNGKFDINHLYLDIVENLKSTIKLSPYGIQLIFSPTSFAHLLSYAFVYSITMDSVIENSSFLRIEDLNKEIFSENLKLIDDPTYPDGILSFRFDDEGCVTSKTPIIEDGILKNLISDNFWNRKCQSYANGNCFRMDRNFFRNYKKYPRPSTTNVIIDFKESSKDLVVECKEAILIKDLGPIYLLNRTTGDFYSSIKNGVYIKNGSVKSSVKPVNIKGNIFDILNKIQMISKEAIQCSLKEISTNFVLPYISIQGI